jgi:hypothetical protein
MDHIHLENNILFDRVDGQEARKPVVKVVEPLTTTQVANKDCCGHCS